MPAKVFEAPGAIAWVDAAPSYSEGSVLGVGSAAELRNFYPVWPYPYLLLVSRNDGERLALSLFDSQGGTIQVNLFALAQHGRPKQVLLGGSSRIDPDDARYHPRASNYTKAWIDKQIAPWLGARGATKLYVRAHFEKADEFFGSFGFHPAADLGAPYMVRELAPAPADESSELEIPETFGAFPTIRDRLRTHQTAHGDAELAYLRASLEDPAHAGAAHAALKEKFEGISLEEFRVQWELASEIGQALRTRLK